MAEAVEEDVPGCEGKLRGQPEETMETDKAHERRKDSRDREKSNEPIAASIVPATVSWP